MTTEFGDKGLSQSKLSRIQESLERNRNIVFHREEDTLTPPIHGFVHKVLFYVAPTTPITDSRTLTRFAYRLSDLKHAQQEGSSLMDYSKTEPPYLTYPNIDFIEDVGVIDIRTTRIPRIIEETLGISRQDLTREDKSEHVLKRRISVKVYPHTIIADLVWKYEKGGIENEQLRHLTYSVPIPDLEALVSGQNPFVHLQNL